MYPTSPPPCLKHALRPTRHASAGTTRLEFALTVAVVGVIAALALDRIAMLQVSARSAQAETRAAQTRSTAALSQAREPLASADPASAPCPITPTEAPRAGAAPGPESPSCP